MERVTVQDDGSLEFHHDDALMNRIYRETWLTRCPEYDQVTAPMLAIVPDGKTHQACPPDAAEEFRQAADLYWRAKIRPWIQQRTAAFLHAAPTARAIELDSPYHHIFIAQEDATVKAITCFLADE